MLLFHSNALHVWRVSVRSTLNKFKKGTKHMIKPPTNSTTSGYQVIIIWQLGLKKSYQKHIHMGCSFIDIAKNIFEFVFMVCGIQYLKKLNLKLIYMDTCMQSESHEPSCHI
jgi:hypothetical protein